MQPEIEKVYNTIQQYNKIYLTWNNYHLFTETEGNSVFCGPETVDKVLITY
jgi:hypothetical protein